MSKMKLEERQLALENEMNTAKDTIWRLTNRIFNLESEVGKLKQVLKQSKLGQIQPSKVASAKFAEIARRRQTSTYTPILERFPKKALPSKSNANIAIVGSTSLNENVDAMIAVKQEPVSDTEQNDLENAQARSSESGWQHHFKDGSMGSESSGSGSSDYDSDEDYKVTGASTFPRKSASRGSRLSVGRPIGSVWRHFKRVSVKSDDGTPVIRAICKFCKQAVSPRSDRLKPHIQKCLANDRKGTLSIAKTAKYTPRKIEKPYGNLISKTEKMESIENAFELSEDGIEEAIVSHPYKVNRSLMRGRKKGAIWKYFDDALITTSNGGTRGIAICKKCRKHLDKKTDRLRSHLKKCCPDVLLESNSAQSQSMPVESPSPVVTSIKSNAITTSDIVAECISAILPESVPVPQSVYVVVDENQHGVLNESQSGVLNASHNIIQQLNENHNVIHANEGHNAIQHVNESQRDKRDNATLIAIENETEIHGGEWNVI